MLEEHPRVGILRGDIQDGELLRDDTVDNNAESGNDGVQIVDNKVVKYFAAYDSQVGIGGIAAAHISLNDSESPHRERQPGS